MKVIAIIPAHLASVRFPGKILYKFHGLPMIEHVRRRAFLSKHINDVYVATCDQEIKDEITSFGGKVIMTSNKHKNGTSRIAEAVKSIECTHVVLLQGDEPLFLPRHLDAVIDSIILNPSGNAWNATAPIENIDELDRHSFVKCIVNIKNNIKLCFRRSPFYSSYENQSKCVRKILGLIAYEKNFLIKLTNLEASPIEIFESIEQMRIIENGFEITSVPVFPSLPSVNEPSEAEIVLNYIENDTEQKKLLDKVLSF